MITNEQLQQCKATLIERQTDLINHVQDHFGLTLESAKESVGELSNYDNHPADLGTELFERGKDVALNEHAEKELEEINEALHSIDAGTYGICKTCGIDIPYQRLFAVPTTDQCIEHAEANIFERDRPVEEEVFSPNLTDPQALEEEKVGYDAEDTWQDVSRYGTSETAADFYGDHLDYDGMYPNSDENIGTVEDLENFVSADINGDFNGITPNFRKYEED
ncbi:TraR/DksA C4-type zinc finger protein [Oceanobacillus chungangensis]|uniref:Zinc finger DksA/TraR C4-type domain-containing protein n=1 Tax=Oceanobacillus chungangensis TaxID=1229152 RepID=A0A3D8PII9_9BACI|nr:TraR/DksA C4-type zinc finger protein [Oceanobacillus chungangensis]RDW15049.1 hypothetical protein CWR45_18695 [Oceanobacillus chungangensis]